MTALMTPNCLDQRSRICPSGCFLTALSRSRAGRARFAEISRVLRISPRTASVSAAWTIATPRKAIHLRRVPMSRGFILVQRESLHRIHPLPHLTPREELITVVCIPERHRRSIAKGRPNVSNCPYADDGMLPRRESGLSGDDRRSPRVPRDSLPVGCGGQCVLSTIPLTMARASSSIRFSAPKQPIMLET